MHHNLSNQPLSRQRGAALVIGLIFLLILTLVLLPGAKDTVLQERMAGHVRESNIAFQTAEDVVRGVEDQLAQQARSGLDLVRSTSWEDSGMTFSDCSGTKIRNERSTYKGTDPTNTLVYEMTSKDGRAIGCKPYEEERANAAGDQSDYFLIFGYAEGPAQRAESLIVTAYYYES